MGLLHLTYLTHFQAETFCPTSASHPQQYLYLHSPPCITNPGSGPHFLQFLPGGPQPWGRTTGATRGSQCSLCGHCSAVWSVSPTSPGSGALCKTQGLPSLRILLLSVLLPLHLVGTQGLQRKVSVSPGVLRNLPLPQGRMKLSFHVPNVFWSLSVFLLSLKSYF